MGKEYTTSRTNRRMGRKSKMRVKVQNATRSTVRKAHRGEFAGSIK